ncbi:MAG: cell division protein ZapA [Clostridia bacterium]|nr:cell division protein ZapA [Clostridia bacterium]
MEQKRKITVNIAGTNLTLITDESDAFVEAVVAMVNEQMNATKSYTVRSMPPINAALLCAIDACGERLKAEKRIRNLEAQASLYEVTIKNLKEELAACKGKENTAEEPAAAADDGFTRLSDMLRNSGVGAEEAEDKVKLLEKYLESRKTPGAGDTRTREEKIRYIESLLRGND